MQIAELLSTRQIESGHDCSLLVEPALSSKKIANLMFIAFLQLRVR